MAQPKFRIVGQPIKPGRNLSPDAAARGLLRQRRDLQTRLRRIDEDLFEHRHRKATERGQKPPLTLEQLALAVDL